MKVQAKLSPLLVISNSTLYNDINRMIMEYIDNAIDSAETIGDLLGNLSSGFTNPLKIKIQISGRYYRHGNIKITDNSTGIKNLRRVVENIGNSDKRKNFALNGQFGYGIYSFMAFCEKLEITTKCSGMEYPECVELSRSKFDVEDISQVEFNIEQAKSFLYNSGTEVKLSGFSSSNWNKIDGQTLKKEIEEHFEMILKRKNIEISITEDGRTYICSPFDYKSYEGTDFERFIEVSYWSLSIKQRASYCDKLKIYLRSTKKNALERPPVLISKGRRIIELYRLKSFRSSHNSDIWNHPNITGYLDTGSILNPTLARNDFQDTDSLKHVFKAIRKQEEEILKWIQDSVKTDSKKDYGEFEKNFNSLIKNLESQDNSERKSLKPNEIVKLSEYGKELNDVMVPENGGTTMLPLKLTKSKRHLNLPPGIVPFLLPETASLKVKSYPYARDRVYIKYPKEKSLTLNIRIDDEAEPLLDSDGEKRRSELIGNTVVIFRKHPDFEERIDKSSRIGEEKVSSELISYIASEVLVHYTDVYMIKNNEAGGSQYKNVLRFFTGKLYSLEKSLKSQIGQPLSK